MSNKNFGRRYAPDPRDAQYRMSAQLPMRIRRQRRYWKDDIWTGDQGNLPHCVGFAWTGWLHAGPVYQKFDGSPCVNPNWLYAKAQDVDEWPGNDYDGTSVRAGAKVLQRLGFIKSYHWALRLSDIVNAVLTIGPVVVGTYWYSRMSTPQSNGLIRAKGRLEGGHAYLITGVNRERRLLRIRQSWGLKWGRAGRCFLPFSDMKRLLRMQGEACLAIEVAKKEQ